MLGVAGGGICWIRGLRRCLLRVGRGMRCSIIGMGVVAGEGGERGGLGYGKKSGGIVGRGVSGYWDDGA